MTWKEVLTEGQREKLIKDVILELKRVISVVQKEKLIRDVEIAAIGVSAGSRFGNRSAVILTQEGLVEEEEKDNCCCRNADYVCLGYDDASGFYCKCICHEGVGYENRSTTRRTITEDNLPKIIQKYRIETSNLPKLS